MKQTVIISDEPLISIGNFTMEQYIDFPMSNKNTASLGGSMRTNDKFGNGSVTASFRRILSSESYLDVTLIYIWLFLKQF